MNKKSLVWMAIAVLLLGLAACAGSKELKKQQAKAAREVGEAYLRQGNYTAALRELFKAEKLYPKDHILQYDLGIVYQKKGRIDLAIKHFKKAIDLKPDFAAAVNNLGTAYYDKGEWDASIACFKKVSEDLIYATPHFAYYNLGKAYFMKKEYALAEKYFLKALETESRFVEPLVELGRTYMAVGRDSEAIAALKSAVDQYPEFARAYFYLAEVRRMSGDYRKALEAYNKVIELVPNEPLAREAQKRKMNLR
ncbi:MAG: tetratricopeptide repeat protein [Deltaproteobacteria bacterium]|nr:MAG: tetratricopeptide repeat protein [Deltaproteobacteria bacterium]